MKKIALFFSSTSVAALAPTALALAQNDTYIVYWLNRGIYWLRLSITVLMIAMTLFFLYSVFKFIQAEGADKDKARKDMFNNIIGLFISVAIWGIIRILGGVVGVDVENAKDTPAVTCPPGLRYNGSTGTCS